MNYIYIETARNTSILKIKTYTNNLSLIHNFEKSFFTLFNLNDAKYPYHRVNNVSIYNTRLLDN